MQTILRNLMDDAFTQGTPVASTSTETELFRHPIDITRLRRMLRCAVEAFGKYNSTGTPTLRFALRLVASGAAATTGTILCKSGLITVGSGVTGALWTVSARFRIKAPGNPGTVFSRGYAIVGSGLDPAVGSATGAAAVSPMGSGGNTLPVDVNPNLLQASDLLLTALWSTPSSSNSVEADDWSVEDFN